MIFLEFDGSFGEPEERGEGPIADTRGNGPLVPEDGENAPRGPRGLEGEAGSGTEVEAEG